MSKKPIIKINGGNPIALCNRCFAIMCYVTHKDENKSVVLSIHGNGIKDYTSAKIGSKVPSYCDECLHLLNYTLNE